MDKIRFIHEASNKAARDHITAELIDRLRADKKVLWLVTGGSNIKIAVDVSKNLKKQKLKNLTVTLTDERFGPIGHADSNWQQLLDAGFQAAGAQLIFILVGTDLPTTAKKFSNRLAEEFARCDYSIGIFGIGPDGHIAGILPASPAIDSAELAVGYKDVDIKQNSPVGVKRGIDRITMTAAAIAKLDEAVLVGFGESKQAVIKKLTENITASELPAQALKKVNKLSIYSDYKGPTP